MPALASALPTAAHLVHALFLKLYFSHPICHRELRQCLMLCYPVELASQGVQRSIRAIFSTSCCCPLIHRQLIDASISKRISELIVWMPTMTLHPFPRYLMTAGEFV